MIADIKILQALMGYRTVDA